MGRLVLRPLDNPTTGVLVSDLSLEEITKTVLVTAKYFVLSDEEAISLTDEDRFNMPFNEFLASFEVCTNWEEVNYMEEAEWERLCNTDFQIVSEEE